MSDVSEARQPTRIDPLVFWPAAAICAAFVLLGRREPIAIEESGNGAGRLDVRR